MLRTTYPWNVPSQAMSVAFARALMPKSLAKTSICSFWPCSTGPRYLKPEFSSNTNIDKMFEKITCYITEIFVKNSILYLKN